MELRKATILAAVVVLVVAAGGCKTVGKADYFVISLEDANDPSLGCSIYPQALPIRSNTKWVVIANYSPVDPNDPNENLVTVELPATLTASSQLIVEEVEAGEIMTFKLNQNLNPGQSYGFIVRGSDGGCVSGLPNPQILIP